MIYQTSRRNWTESTDNDFVSDISSSSATHDDSDDSDYCKGTSATKNSNRKKPTARNKQGGGNDRCKQQSKQPTVNSSQASAATSTRIEQKH